MLRGAATDRPMKRAMTIMIDARMLVGRFSGVARYVTAVVDELARYEGVGVVALCGNEPYAPWAHRSDIQTVHSSFSRRDRQPARRIRWERSQLPAYVRDAGVDIYHATWNTGIPPRCPVPAVLTIHDLIPWTEPVVDVRSALERRRYRRAVRSSAKRAHRIVTVSEHVRGRVIETLGLRPDRVTTIHNGIVPPPATVPESVPADDAVPAGPYVLYVGGYEPRKNIESLFTTMNRYWSRYDKKMALHLTGSASALSAAAREVYGRLPSGAPVVFLGQVDDHALSRQYAHAQALILLSRDEGFGLPVLEAMAHGCPVITSDRSSLPEIVGRAGVLVNPDRPEEVARAIHDVVSDCGKRSDLIEHGLSRANRLTWRHTTRRLVSVYEQVLRSGAEKRPQQVPWSAGDDRLQPMPS